MPEKGAPDADAEFDPARCRRAARHGRHSAALQRILGEPHRSKALGFGRHCQFDTTLGCEAAMQPDTNSWRVAHPPSAPETTLEAARRASKTGQSSACLIPVG